jgi:hypothetical protein
MKVWVTKYALTVGIKVIDVDIIPSSKMIKYGHSYLHGEGKEFHLNEKSAVAKANEMVSAKIKSLEKSLLKFKALKFEVKS